MKKRINKLKNYKPSNYVCYLYFFVPIFVCSILNVFKESDIYFLLKHGEYVLQNGFPTIEPFTMHQGFSFVMQQWLSAVIFYIAHRILGLYGLKMVLEILNCLLLFFLYKLCMLISNNKLKLSVVCSCITETLLLIFFVPRPWIFTFLFLIILLYIMELFYLKNNSKCLLFLPILSLLQINCQSSMWFMLYLFILPYMVCLIIDKIKDKNDNRVYKLLLTVVFMFLFGFMNPYGLDNILYVFNSYGNEYINKLVIEMLPPIIGFHNTVQNIYGNILFILIMFVTGIYIFFKKGKLELRHILLSLGVTVLALLNIRSIPLYIIGSIPFTSAYLKSYFHSLPENENKYELCVSFKKQYIFMVIFLSLYTIVFLCTVNGSTKFEIENGVDKILKYKDAKNSKIYVGYGYGSYLIYRGLTPYMDGRAEVFLKNNNHKEDILKEYYLLNNGYLDYSEFISKYEFGYMIIMKNDEIYREAIEDNNYKVIYKEKKYSVFKRLNKN